MKTLLILIALLGYGAISHQSFADSKTTCVTTGNTTVCDTKEKSDGIKSLFEITPNGFE